MKVFIDPIYTGTDAADGGIRRVSEAMVKYLPAYGWEIATSPDDADLIANHGASLTERPGVPMVAHCHGLMWASYEFGEWGDKVNKAVIETMVRANAITAPSQWVAHAISRGMLARPEVIYHGVDAGEWAHSERQLGYVLWNKARVDQVSDPRDMNDVAALLPHIPFLSTFGRPASNVHILGAMPLEQMRPLVQKAGVYLATARETFGIGTLEALAAGVPVAGWRYGGQMEIVIDGETGYLVEYGDYDALAAAIQRCLRERERLSENCVEDAQSRWAWQDKIAQYAALYTRVHQAYHQPRPKVSVVVTAHNLATYLPDAIGSVQAQTLRDWECLIVDDQSTDNTPAVAERIADADDRVFTLRTPHNLKLPGARNFGFSHANGRYILFLDADDLLAPNALELLATALDRDTSIHIAYGALDTMSADGTNRQRNPWPAGAFNWHAQLAHLNQLHGAAMLRREVIERSGGYRVRDWRAEDASFWSRVTSFGFRAAHVTDDTVQIYRMHEAQKSRTEDGDGDWTAWFPWRLAADPHAGVQAMQAGAQPNPVVVPFAAQGTPPAPLRAWPVHHHQAPIVSVIIPVGPGHAPYLVDALDSVQAQTMPFWETIVVCDAKDWQDQLPPHLPAHPWARVYWAKGRGAGAARNVGLHHAHAPLCLFLDADDLLTPRALETLLRAFVQSGGQYVYSDWLTLEDETRIDGQMTVRTVEDYDQYKMLQGLRHAVTALLPVEWVRSVGGFDEQLQVFEDWDLYCKLAIAGYCGTRTPHPLLIYRTESGLRTRTALSAPNTYTPLGEQTAAALYDRYAAYLSGEEQLMACGTCGGNTVTDAQQALDLLSLQTGGAVALSVEGAPAVHGPVRMEFIGDQWGAVTYVGKVSGTQYRAGRDPSNRFHDVDPRDVEHFLSSEKWRIVPQELLESAARTDEPEMIAAEPQMARQRGRKR